MKDTKINYDKMADKQKKRLDKSFMDIAQLAVDLNIIGTSAMDTKTFHMGTQDQNSATISVVIELIIAGCGCRTTEELSAIGILDDGEIWCDDCIWNGLDDCKNGQDLINLVLSHRDGVEKNRKESGITEEAIRRQINDPTGYQAYLASQNNNKSNQPG